jgi:hypothetical protein
MQIPNDFFTATSIITLAGASAAVLLVTSVIGYLFNLKTSQTVKKWLSLVLSFALSFFAASLVKNKTTSIWIVAAFNSFLIFATATGANTIYGATPGAALTQPSATAPTQPLSKARKSVVLSGKIKLSPSVNISKAKGKFTDRWW